MILVLLKEDIWTIIEVHQYLRPWFLIVNRGLKDLCLRFLFVRYLFWKLLSLRHLLQRLDPFSLISLILFHYLQNILHKLCAIKRHSWTLNSRTRTFQTIWSRPLPFFSHLVNNSKLCANHLAHTKLILLACLHIDIFK
jgi:hypothetical protein